MSTSTVVPGNPKSAAGRSAKRSFLSALGHLGREAVTKVFPMLVRDAQVCEPIVELLFPMEGALYGSVVNAICQAEVAGANAAAGAATGPAKWEAVWNAVGPQLLSVAHEDGLVGETAETAASRYVQAIFNLLDGPAKMGVNHTAAS